MPNEIRDYAHFVHQMRSAQKKADQNRNEYRITRDPVALDRMKKFVDVSSQLAIQVDEITDKILTERI